jgi:hypothetical protein
MAGNYEINRTWSTLVVLSSIYGYGSPTDHFGRMTCWVKMEYGHG